MTIGDHWHGNIFIFSNLLRPWQKWTDEHVQKSCARGQQALCAAAPSLKGSKSPGLDETLRKNMRFRLVPWVSTNPGTGALKNNCVTPRALVIHHCNCQSSSANQTRQERSCGCTLRPCLEEKPLGRQSSQRPRLSDVVSKLVRMENLRIQVPQTPTISLLEDPSMEASHHAIALSAAAFPSFVPFIRGP